MRDLVHEPRGQHLAADVAGGDLDRAVARELLRLGHGRLDAVGEVEGRVGDQPSGAGRCDTTTTWSIPPGGVPPQPSVMSKTWRPTTVTPISSQYARV